MPTRQRISLRTGDFELLSAGADGGSDAPVAICLHGFPDHPPSFGPLLDALARAGYRAFAPWMRGYAPSTLEGPFDLEALAGDVRALADALSPGQPVFLAGHDWGAAITSIAAGMWPDRIASAVTMAVPHPLSFLAALPGRPDQLKRSWYMGLFQLPWVAERAIARGDHALIERLYRDWSPGLAMDPEAMRAVKACIARSMPAPIAYYRALVRPLVPAILRHARSDRPERRIRAPLLHLAGEQDGCVGATVGDGGERFCAGAFRREVVPGVGHFLQIEAPDAIAARVVAWFAETRIRG